MLPSWILQIPIVLCYYQLALQNIAHSIALSKLSIWWLASHQVKWVRVLGQSSSLLLREDCDFDVSVLTLQKKVVQLLFWRCYSSGMSQPNGSTEEELLGAKQEDRLIWMLMWAWFLQVLNIMFKYLKKPHSEWGGNGWCAAVLLGEWANRNLLQFQEDKRIIQHLGKNNLTVY